MRLHDVVTPTLAEAHARIDAIRPDDYARTRNALDGAVTGLSPYITHGFVDLPAIVDSVVAKHGIGPQHRFMFELGWREFFHHVRQKRGDAIFASMHPGPLPEDAYVQALPADLREARTGVPAIDAAVRMLYDTGYLHNHARLWLASYVVHLRRVHWRVGADWMYAHLLDGDLASNHLSWQWVAGTFSRKPYLFNAENVAMFAPEPWCSRGSSIDMSYEVLEAVARGAPIPTNSPLRAGTTEPAARHDPPARMHAEPANHAAVAGRDVWLIHPWSLCDPPDDLPDEVLRLALCTKDFHSKWPWSESRWEFVGARLQELTSLFWFDSLGAIKAALRSARSVRGIADAHLDDTLGEVATLYAPRRLFTNVERSCSSFSQWWKRTHAQADERT